ncbi:MAG: tripartite tricarboxylate transporter TctB family protein, partial [Pseudothermotoga sp.]
MADLILSLTTLCFSIYLFVESSKLPKGVSNIPGPGFFPNLVAWVVLILSFMLLSNSVWKIVKKKDQRIIQGRWKQILLVIIGTFAYVLLWGTGNFLINTWLLLFFIQLMT